MSGSLSAAGLNGCVLVPVSSDGTPIYPGAASFYPAVPITVPTVSPSLATGLPARISAR